MSNTYTLTPQDQIAAGLPASIFCAPLGDVGTSPYPEVELFVTPSDGVTFQNATMYIQSNGAAGAFVVTFPSPGNYSVYGQVSGNQNWVDPYNASSPLTVAVLSNPVLTTLDYVKDFGNIQVTTYDSYLTNRIASASAAVENWCRRCFALNSYTEVYDGPGSTTLLLNNDPIASLSQVITGFNNDLPRVVPGDQFWFTVDTIGFLPTSTYNGWFPYGNQSIQVEYTAGYAQIPTDVQDAVAMIVTKQLSLMGADTSMKNEKMGDYLYNRASLLTIPNEVQAILTPYRKYIV